MPLGVMFHSENRTYYLSVRDNITFGEYSQQKLDFHTSRQNLQTSSQHEYAVHAEEVKKVSLGIGLSRSKMHAAGCCHVCVVTKCVRHASFSANCRIIARCHFIVMQYSVIHYSRTLQTWLLPPVAAS